MAHPNDNSGPDEISLVYRASRATLIAAGVFSCIVNILMLTGPLFMLQVYDRVLASGSVSTLVALIMIVAALYAYYGFLEFLRARLMVRLGRRVEERLRGRVFDAVTAHALRRTPGVGSQPLNDLATIRQYLSGQGPFAFFDMPWMPFYLGIIFLMHWMLGVASLAAAITIFALAVWSERATRGPLQEATKSTVKAAIMTDEGRRNAEALSFAGHGRHHARTLDWRAPDRPRPPDHRQRRGRHAGCCLARAPSVHPVRHSGTGRLSGNPSRDFTRHDDRGLHHHVAGARAGGAGRCQLAAVPRLPQGARTARRRPQDRSEATRP